MNVLVIGSGGREHAVCLKLSESKLVDKLYCAPGNGGISEIATCIDISATDIEGICSFSKKNNIDFVVVTPDDPLALGMVDALEEIGIKSFGPRKNAAIIEASKSFSKDLMKKYNIPTASYEVFDDSDLAKNYLKTCSFPIVVKADGLALGKGVLICGNLKEAIDAIDTIMIESKFGRAGLKVVIEEFLIGQEITVLAFTDGKCLIPMVSSQDHKRAFDNDEGLNTGGMGTFSPSLIYNFEDEAFCMENIFIPTMNAMNMEGRTFKGVLYFGLIKTKEGIKVIE